MDGLPAALQPEDEFNRALQQNVRPADWDNPVPGGPYQLVVIGAGTAGLVTAAAAAGLGVRVALVERELMGGDCLNVGCVPSKALIRSARQADMVHRAAEFAGQSCGAWTPDFAFVMERMRRLRAGISPHDSAARFQELGVDVFLGHAAFSGRNALEVRGIQGTFATIEFRKAVIATGARAAAPEIPGLASVDYLTNETLFSLTERPDTLGVIGGGPIGCEMAQAFARLGSNVVLFERSERILSREDAQASAVLLSALRRDGIDVRLNCRELRLNAREHGQIDVVLGSDDAESVVTIDQLLVAVGRKPNTDGLNLAAAGVDANDQGVLVDDHLQTSNPTVYAAGDVCSSRKFTHAADFQARIVIQNALFALGPLGRRKASALNIPRATYTSPEVAHVGLTSADAVQSGVAIDTWTQELAQVDRAILDGQSEGFVRVHTRMGTDRIVGATIVAEHAGELISQITLAMDAGIGLAQIGSTIHPYPTQAEAIRKLGDQYQKSRLTRPVQWVLERLLRWNVGA